MQPWLPGSQDPRILAGGLQTGDGGAEAQDGSPAIGQVGPTTSRELEGGSVFRDVSHPG